MLFFLCLTRAAVFRQYPDGKQLWYSNAPTINFHLPAMQKYGGLLVHQRHDDDGIIEQACRYLVIDFGTCRVPCDYIPKRSYPLFRTRQILNDWLTQNLEEA